MKNNQKKKGYQKWLACLMAGIVGSSLWGMTSLAAGMAGEETPIPTSSYQTEIGQEETEKTKESQSENRDKIEEMQKEETENSTPAKKDGALTPEGNLSLEDDIGPITGEGKQFITLVTKAGNYFYLIIDRDADGKNIVYFLNQVDEADLLALMDEEEAEQYTSSLSAREQEDILSTSDPEAETAFIVEETKVEKEPVKKKELSGNMGAWIVLLVFMAGGGTAGVMKWKGRQQKRKNAQDPDEEYVNALKYDEADYELPEEMDEEDDMEEEGMGG